MTHSIAFAYMKYEKEDNVNWTLEDNVNWTLEKCHDLLKTLDDYPKTIMSRLNNALMNVVARVTQTLLLNFLVSHLKNVDVTWIPKWNISNLRIRMQRGKTKISMRHHHEKHVPIKNQNSCFMFWNTYFNFLVKCKVIKK